MVEDQGLPVGTGPSGGEGFELLEAEAPGFGRVVHAHGFSAGAGQEDDGEGEASRVPTRVGVDVEEVLELDVQAGLLLRLTARGVLDRLPAVDEGRRGSAQPKGGRPRRTRTTVRSSPAPCTITRSTVAAGLS